MKELRACISVIALLTAAMVLSACGGGGGGGNTGGSFPALTYSIMGIVYGAPQGVTVTLSGNANTTTTTNAIGYYQFTGLANGSYTVTASMPGYLFSPASKPVTISSANAGNTDFTVTNAYNITGTVSGAPQGVTIMLSGDAIATTTTNSIGYYEFIGHLSRRVCRATHFPLPASLLLSAALMPLILILWSFSGLPAMRVYPTSP